MTRRYRRFLDLIDSWKFLCNINPLVTVEEKQLMKNEKNFFQTFMIRQILQVYLVYA